MNDRTRSYLKTLEARFSAMSAIAEIAAAEIEFAEAETPESDEDGREALHNLRAGATKAGQALAASFASASHAFGLAWGRGPEAASEAA